MTRKAKEVCQHAVNEAKRRAGTGDVKGVFRHACTKALALMKKPRETPGLCK